MRICMDWLGRTRMNPESFLDPWSPFGPWTCPRTKTRKGGWLSSWLHSFCPSRHPLLHRREHKLAETTETYDETPGKGPRGNCLREQVDWQTIPYVHKKREDLANERSYLFPFLRVRITDTNIRVLSGRNNESGGKLDDEKDWHVADVFRVYPAMTWRSVLPGHFHGIAGSWNVACEFGFDVFLAVKGMMFGMPV